MWYNRIISLIMYWLAGTVRLTFFSIGCIVIILWAWSANHFCARDSVDVVSTIVIGWHLWVSRGTVLCSYRDQKSGCFSFGENNTFLAIISHVYLDYGIISRYQLACEPQYKFLSMSVTFQVCHNAHNPSIKYWINGQTSGFGGMRSALNHSEIVYYSENLKKSWLFSFLLK